MIASSARTTLFLLFALSGFAGLIYESIWSHYLKLFLGHAAYAQTLVLAIFMGGMAIGSWLASLWSPRLRNLLLGYAIAEGIIGVCGMGFHTLYVVGTDAAYAHVIPALGSTASVKAFQWALAAFSVLPQSILLGMTFPLMTGAIIRRFPAISGSSIATLYFTNSLGAAAGALASGFFLVGWVGLPGTIMAAGLLNVLLALAVWIMAKHPQWRENAPIPVSAPLTSESRTPWFRFMLTAAFITGAASFLYEIGWIRMLSLVLGSSTHAFELMLSAFILGLAFGGLWIRRRIDGIDNPTRFVAVVQVIMGMLALSTLVLYGHTFDLMSNIMAALRTTDAGYAAFNLFSHVIALAVMFPTTFCAGMTLPLITHSLIKRGYGERSIGAVYATNTVGAIAGIVVAVHFAMPVLGLKGVITLGAVLDIGLGIILLRSVSRSNAGRGLAIATSTGLAAVAATILWVELDPSKMASGVYRTRAATVTGGGDVRYHRDGKTATVNLISRPGGHLAVTTNGKPDAAINMTDGPPSPDEATMILAAALPLALHPSPEAVAVIGMGSGLTTHVTLGDPNLRQVDTIEIEPAMVEAAQQFKPRVSRAFDDPRSAVHIDDAKAFFASQRRRYDIIISEPSNPWVSGVASLFSSEFYQRITEHLRDAGLFAQWLQLYEIDRPLVAAVVKALSPSFEDYVIYNIGDAEMLVVAKKRGRLALDPGKLFAKSMLAKELERIGIRDAKDLELYRIAGKAVLEPWFQAHAVAANSDFFPVLDLNAARTRYLGRAAPEIIELTLGPLPIFEVLEGRRPHWNVPQAPETARIMRMDAVETAIALLAYLERPAETESPVKLPPGLMAETMLFELLLEDCSTTAKAEQLFRQVMSISDKLVPYLPPNDLASIWQKVSQSGCLAPLTARERQWFELIRAVSRRDIYAMATLSTRLLETAEGNSPGDKRDYLVAAAMLGYLAQGAPERAKAVWNDHGQDLFRQKLPGLHLQYLKLLSIASPTLPPGMLTAAR